MSNDLIKKLKEIEEKIGKNWMNELENIKSSDDLIKKSNSHDIELSKELAEEGFALLFKEQELSEEELANIAGGSDDDDDKGGPGPKKLW